jgi:hypothetical protein
MRRIFFLYLHLILEIAHAAHMLLTNVPVALTNEHSALLMEAVTNWNDFDLFSDEQVTEVKGMFEVHFARDGVVDNFEGMRFPDGIVMKDCGDMEYLALIADIDLGWRKVEVKVETECCFTLGRDTPFLEHIISMADSEHWQMMLLMWETEC